jgi:hypothetical protein
MKANLDAGHDWNTSDEEMEEKFPSVVVTDDGFNPDGSENIEAPHIKDKVEEDKPLPAQEDIPYDQITPEGKPGDETVDEELKAEILEVKDGLDQELMKKLDEAIAAAPEGEATEAFEKAKEAVEEQEDA